MCSKQSTIVHSIVLAIAATLFAADRVSSAPFYSFLSVSGNGIAGNFASSTFTSSYGNGVINVTHHFSPGGAGLDDNNNPLISPSSFPINFPGTGIVQGHLAQTVYNHTSDITFDLTNYNLKPTTVFGMWNTTTQVNIPAYRISLLDNTNTIVPPATFNTIGDEDNVGQVTGQWQMKLVPGTGDIINGIFRGGSTHTDAAFWDNIPAGTQEIIVHGNLGQLNPIGDGVGYYFAELVPEPSSIVLSVLGVLAAVICAIRKKR